MKKKSDLDDTKPIVILTEDMDDEDSVVMSRAEKYKDLDEEVKKETEEVESDLVEISEEEKAAMESAEEALVEKNINEAEKLLKEEADNKKEDKKSLIDKFKELPKKKKILVIVLFFVILALLITLLVLLLGKGSSKPKEEMKRPKEEEKINIVDNYYYKDGKLHILTSNDEELGVYECKNKDEDSCYVSVNTYRDGLDVARVLDENGEDKTERMPVYNDDFVFIFDNVSGEDNIILYSLKEKKEKATFKETKAYNNEFLILKDTNGKYGLYQFKEALNIVISPTYNKLYMIDDSDKLIGESGKGYVLINKVGKVLSDVISTTGEIKYYNSSYIVVKENEKYSVYDLKNNVILDKYSFITVEDGFIFGVKDDNKLYIYDGEGAKYNEVGIALKNNDYVVGYMYGEDGKLKKTMRSFKKEIQKTTIEVMLYNRKYEEDKNVSISILEGTLNKNFKLYSYLNGVIYYYSDETKRNVIGSYKCDVVNNVSDNNMSLSSCMPALDTVFEDNDMMAVGEENRHSMIPVYNNRFVFVQDGAKNVKLYDLVDNKAIAKYTQVNTYTPNNDNVLILSNGEFNVVGVNKNGQYGIINISETQVQAVYPFEYGHIEKVGTRFIGKKANDKWIILGGNGTEYKYKIRGFSNNADLVKIKGTNYDVVDSSGNVIDSSLKYVQIYDAFYAGVDSNNKLMLYTYEGYSLLKEPVALSSTTYCRTDKPSFKINVSTDGKVRTFVISIFDGSNYKDVTVKEKTNEEPPKPEDNNEPINNDDNNGKENNETPPGEEQNNSGE